MDEHRLHCDVLVVGSGGAALSAALRSAAAGLSVIVAEKSVWLGGTTAMSGGATWVPVNHHARAAGIVDSSAEVMRYLSDSAPPGWAATESPLWQAFVDSAGEMLQFVEQHTPLRFALTSEGDPLAEIAGAKAWGRMVAPLPLRASTLAEKRWKIRPSPLPQLYTYHETIGLDIWHHPLRESLRMAPKLAWRALTRTRTKGAALITGLLEGCRRLGCRIETDAQVVKLLTRGDHQVSGAVLSQHGKLLQVSTTRGVVLACGGFEWDAQRRTAHFPGATDFIASPRSNTGDGHRMAEEIGAALAHMDQANMGGGIPARYMGEPYGLSVFFQYEPNAILVNRHGRRFVNEFTFNLGEALDQRDQHGMPLQLPVWMIADARLLRRSPLLRYYAWRSPGWLRKADTLSELAAELALPVAALQETVNRFNGFCPHGEDQDFQRHLSSAHGKSDTRLRGGLLPIERAPFIAVPFNRTFLATKGGPRTDEQGRVRHQDGRIIQGLFCAGVGMANPIGTRAVGAGTTLGPNLTWGYICGRTLAADVADAARHPSEIYPEEQPCSG
ncbi:FAD-dependent oxidoreductase [Erwinia endophytica]|uniref:FAD-binding protein n=1 Tax=Erwinia endophytica TaxID=1563158 RepID=UPI001265F59E|nr:FAD-binding protein [Erwinia endophytica]KAB8313803.1 FAD-dependent oxidoreductase [Erwinia endophytica]